MALVGDDEGLMSQDQGNGCLVLKFPLGGSTSTGFRLEDAVCNHGFFMLAPNVWDPTSKTFSRPLRLADSLSCVRVSISQSCDHSTANGDWLNIRIHDNQALSPANRQAILKQVGRMLRISEKDDKDVSAFQEMHPHAKAKGFGRLFRSPSLFEDACKTYLLCACRWKRSLEMAQALCDLQLEQFKSNLKRKRAKSVMNDHDVIVGGNFPSPAELASLSKKFLEEKCNLGYRAALILDLARRVADGKLDLEQLEFGATEVEANAKAMSFKGYGQFASATLLMCMGFYQRVPCDSETLRHLKEVHMVICSKKDVEEQTQNIYRLYSPFQCLAFWLEITDSYEQSFGKLSELPSSLYHTVAGSKQSVTKKSILVSIK